MGLLRDDGAPPSKLPDTPAQKAEEGTPPENVDPGQGPEYVIHARVNFVEVPFTVKDHKGALVPGLTWRDVRVYENNLRQQLTLFTVDPFSLSVALVIDQSMTFDNMAKVNNALAALQGAFTPYDEVSLITYNNGPKTVTQFTGAQSARLTQALENLEDHRAGGADLLQHRPASAEHHDQQRTGTAIPIRIRIRATGPAIWESRMCPGRRNTLNDAILSAGVALSKAAKGRRRIVYVISDGKEYGSTAKFAQVVKYLNTNQIAVFGTLVGDSALPVTGFLDRMHLPLQMRDNILPAYANATGGNFDGEFRQKGIETSFAKIAEEVRTQYTVGYYTHHPFIDGKYRTLEVKCAAAEPDGQLRRRGTIRLRAIRRRRLGLFRPSKVLLAGCGRIGFQWRCCCMEMR